MIPDQLSKEFYMGLLDDSIDTVWVMSAEGIVLFHSNNIPEAFGFNIKDILHHSIFEFVHPSDLRKAHMALSQALNNPDHPIFIELRAKTKSTAYLWVEVRAVNRIRKPHINGIVCSLRIIQQAKEAEYMVKKREAFYCKLIEEGEDVVYLLDADKNICFISDNITKILGYEHSEIIGIKYTRLIHPDDKEEINNAFELAFQNPSIPIRVEYRFFRKDGLYIWREGSITNRLSDPVINAIVFYGKDITTRKNIEQMLKHQKQFLEGILNKLPFALAILDVENRFLYINSKYIEDKELHNWAIGKTESEYYQRIGLNSRKLKKRNSLFSQAVTTNTNKEWKDEYSDEKGNIKIALHHYCPIGKDAEGRELILSYDIDITEIQKAEQSLRESELLFRSTFEQAAVGIVHLGTNLKWIRMNQKFCDMLGFSQQELMKLSVKEITHPDDMEMDFNIRSQIISGEKTSASFEKRYIRKDGKYFWANLTLSMVYNDEQKPQHIIGIIQDINDKKQTEENLIAKNTELNTFIYRASHDLRGPIASLLGLTKVAQYELQENKTAISIINKVTATAERLDEILTSLIDITKLQQGGLTIEKIDFKEIIRGILQMLENISGTSLITINQQIENIKDFHSDKGLIRSVLQNLIENAIKYSQELTTDAKIEIKIIKAGTGVNILVKDNGIGIKKEVQGKVFDIFYRATGKSNGSGLGLYIVKSAVAKLGGTIDLHSEENKGTTFTVSLPSAK